MRALNVRDGYRLWARSYSDETAISFLENRLVSAMSPALAGMRLLDAGCGTGRRLRNTGAATAVGLDLSYEMLAAGVARDGPLVGVQTIVGDVCDMPLPKRAFDIVWCRLVLGHLRRIEEAYAELARVADHGACVIVSDFHAAAHDLGHRAGHHLEVARKSGLVLSDMREAVIGNDVRSFYENAGLGAVYPDHIGLPVVLVMAFRRECWRCGC